MIKNKYILIFLIPFFLFSCKLSLHVNDDQPLTKLPFKEQKLENGKLERIDSFPSKYVAPRSVDIWLPENYDASKKYQVLYMNDGQRLFTGTNEKGDELRVDEIASKLLQNNKIEDLIVVGIESIGRLRHSNYFPEKPYNDLPKKLTDSLRRIGKAMNMGVKINSDSYLKFIVKEVKPYIDANYATYTDFKNTYIGGASMGGLISMYAVCEYPDVFGGALCMSTHWPGFLPSVENPIPDAFFKYMKEHLPSPETHKFYFDFGTEGMDRFYVQYEDEVDAVFALKGYTEANFNNQKVEGGNHAEEFWSQRFDVPLLFLFGKN